MSNSQAIIKALSARPEGFTVNQVAKQLKLGHDQTRDLMMSLKTTRCIFGPDRYYRYTAAPVMKSYKFMFTADGDASVSGDGVCQGTDRADAKAKAIEGLKAQFNNCANVVVGVGERVK